MVETADRERIVKLKYLYSSVSVFTVLPKESQDDLVWEWGQGLMNGFKQ